MSEYISRTFSQYSALSPILVTELGIVTEVNLVQPSKALLPIEVTELPMVTVVRPEQSLYLQMHLYQSLTC